MTPKVNDKILAQLGGNKTTRLYMTVSAVNGTTVDAFWPFPVVAELPDKTATGLTYDEGDGQHTWRWPPGGGV